MKKIFTFLFIAILSSANAQIILGDATGTATIKTSVLVDFPANQNKGLILPYLRTLPSTPTEGTLVLDAVDATNARIKYYNGAWIDLSGQSADITADIASQPTSAQVAEMTSAKTIIGANSSSADGVLVLESTTKSMILPIVSDVQNIISPSPGMMVYVNKSGAKRLAVYNGSKWSYWKP